MKEQTKVLLKVGAVAVTLITGTIAVMAKGLKSIDKRNEDIATKRNLVENIVDMEEDIKKAKYLDQRQKDLNNMIDTECEKLGLKREELNDDNIELAKKLSRLNKDEQLNLKIAIEIYNRELEGVKEEYEKIEKRIEKRKEWLNIKE
jgi:protein subunit release factor A